jgi:hypothetical protein
MFSGHASGQVIESRNRRLQPHDQPSLVSVVGMLPPALECMVLSADTWGETRPRPKQRASRCVINGESERQW